MTCRDVTSQTEFESAEADPAVTCIHVTGSSRVVARGSSRVEASGSSRVVARGSSRVEAWDSSQVEAWDSSRVVARDSSRVEAWDSSQVVASKYVAIHRHGPQVTIVEGTTAHVIDVPDCTDLDDWADYHGARRTGDGRIVAYKALGDRLESDHRLPDGSECVYLPDTTVVAPDWDEQPSCGGGLHVSPSPIHAERYRQDATRYVAVAVDPAETVAIPSFHGASADKLKARQVEVLYEVDRWGGPIAEEVSA